MYWCAPGNPSLPNCPGPAPGFPDVNRKLFENDFKSVFEFLSYRNGSVLAPPSTAIFGLNFRDGTNASLAIDEALQLQILAQQYNGGALATGLLAGFEIGNEVDEDNDDGKRSGPWTPDMYWAQWGAYVKNITAALGLTSAPDTAIFQAAVFTMGIPAWDQSLIAVMLNGTYKDYIRTVSYHRYGTASRCNGINITMDDFLSDNITENSLGHGDLNEVVAAARQANVTVYMGETNSIACGGQYGLSDSFASSMWIVDWMVTLARMGWHGFNLHGGSGNAYTPVTFTSQGDLSAYVRPGYIGMLAGMEFLINATSLVNISAISTTVPAPGNDTSGFSGLGLKAHAGIDRDGVMRIFLLHRAFRQTSPANVTVQLAAGLVSAWPQSASLARLWAPNATDGVYSTSGVAWAGLSFDGTTDGKPVGTRTEEVVPILMDSSGSATVTCTLPPGSAAMLIIHTAQA